MWLHILRVSVLTIAAVGVAWVVASAQRRAILRRAVAPVAADDASPAYAAAPEDLNFEAQPMPAVFESIEVPIALSTAVEVRLEPPEQAVPQVPMPDATSPELTLDVGTDFVPTLPVIPFFPRSDPYIGSSKSMVFTPGTLTPADSKQRHGKP